MRKWKGIASALEGCLLASLAVSALATAVFVLPRSYHLTRQVDAGQLDLLQKALVACYSMSLYLVAVLPLGLLLGLPAAAWLRRRRARDAGAADAGSGTGRGAATLRRAALGVGLVPVAVASIGLLLESSGTGPPLEAGRSRADRGPNVVLIVIDTLRADHLGSYGHPFDTSPALDGLARSGVRFARCHTTASWTKPSVASILTSLHSAAHGAKHFQSRLPEGATTLAEALREAGLLTYAYVSNPNLKSIFDFDQGFDSFDDHLLRDRLYLAALRDLPLLSGPVQRVTGRTFSFRDRDDAATANARILPWLERHHDQRFFMYLHYMDPHSPYSPPPPYDTMFPRGEDDLRSRLLAAYDGEIRFLDHHLGRLLARFEELGIRDETLFVVTSDHGEAFGEHGDWLHDHTVYQEQLHVPLILAYEGGLPAGVVVDEAVGSIDIAPTVLDVAGVAPPDTMQGRSLRPLWEAAEAEREAEARDVFVDHYSAAGRYRLRSCIAEGRWKYILTLKSRLRDVRRLGDEELYDLAADPEERRNLARRHREQLSELRDHCAEAARSSRRGAQEPSELEVLDEATERQLRALGYIE